MIAEQVSRKVSELMSRYPIWVRPDQSFKDTLDIMALHKVSHLPVCEGKKIVGMISKSDLLDKAIFVAEHSSGKTFTKHQIQSIENRSIMSPDILFIKESGTEDEAKALMLGHSIHALPVVNSDLEIKGIVTFYDLIK
jgi:CBS domain-containing protein